MLPGPAGGVSDAALLGRFVHAGDEAAFELLVWRYGPVVLGVCRRVLRHEQDAEDAFQATFLTLARQAGSISQRASLGGWLYTVAYRVALRARQRRAARGRREGPLEGEPPPGPGAGPAEELARREAGPLLEAEVARLPEKYRAAFVLCNLQGKTNAEAAELLGCPKGTVLSRLARARERLRRRLGEQGLGPAALPCLGLVADVSPVLVTTAAYLAGLVAAGKALAGAVSPAALALADEAVLSLAVSGIKKVGGLLAVLVAAASGVAALAYAPAPSGPPSDPCLRKAAAAAPVPVGPSRPRPAPP
jgi:RNA polymerase sigma factor (sigma-70 family)